KSNMNQKAYSILFCALLASTFVTELRAKGLDYAHHNRHKLSQDRTEIREQKQCSWVCRGAQGGSLKFIVNVNANLVAIFDFEFNVAIVFDISSNYVAVFNGNTGIVIAINLSTSIAFYITAEISGSVWSSSKVSFESFFTSLSLSVFFSISGAVQFEVKKASSEVQQALGVILEKLVFGIEIDVSESFTLLLSISVSYIEVFKTSLKGGLVLFGNGAISLYGNLSGFLQTLISFSNIVVLVGGVQVLISAGINFNFNVLFSASFGSQFLVNVIQQISVNINISEKFSGTLNKAEYFFALLAQSGGSGSGNITGIYKIASSIIGLIDKSANASITKVIDYLVQYSISSNTDVAGFYSSLDGFVSVFEANANLKASFSGLISIVEALKSKSFVYKGVNISAIIELLIESASKDSSYSLVLVVSVLLQLKAIISESESCSYLLFVLIVYSNTAAGLSILKKLNIAIKVSSGVKNNLLISLFSGFNIVAFLFGNFYSAISGSAIGGIAVAVSKAVKVSSSGKLEFSKLLNASTNVVNLIKGAIQTVTGLSLGVSTSVKQQASSAITAVSGAKGSFSAGASFGFKFGFSSSGGVSISG
ncbi:hypothetical protein, partial [Staphylococcus aureus]|uniref:hypothetical protein n=1 Tax=Staphylococcus aureus TaxID=1280 RepID=UPI0023AFE623